MKQTSISDLKQERASRNGTKNYLLLLRLECQKTFQLYCVRPCVASAFGVRLLLNLFFLTFAWPKPFPVFFCFSYFFCLLMCFFYYFIVFLIFLRRQPQGEGIHPPTGGGRQLTVRSLVLGKGVYLTLGAFSYPRNMGCRSFNHMCSYNKHHI